jgi:acyl-CoA synthetase (AMP-forming)/AMP-acid ligase II
VFASAHSGSVASGVTSTGPADHRTGASSGAEELLARLRSATDHLVQPGGPFEIREEIVLGERMAVFENRLRSFSELVAASAHHGDKEFLVFEDGLRLSFRGYADAVRAVARSLRRDYRLAKGDRVAICAANSPGWVLAASGALWLGAVVCALNSWWTAPELAAGLELVDPTIVMVDERRRALLPALGPSVRVVDVEGVTNASTQTARVPEPGRLDDRAPDPGRVDDRAPEPGRVDDAPDVEEDDPAVLLFTSGTSGVPKAAILSHRCLLGFVQLSAFIGARSASLAGTRPDPHARIVRLAVFPMFHISGLGSFLAALGAGNTTVWPSGRFDPARVIELTEAEGINMWSGASTHIARLLESPSLHGFDGAALRQVGIGGSATTPSLIDRTEDRFPHLTGTFASGYGMTESGGLVSYAPNFLLRMAADCVGPPLPTIGVRIEREDGSTAAEGEEGVICVRSPIVMRGYWRNPDANERAMLPGRWLRTDDFGRIDGGLLYVAARRRDLIIRGGENVYPAEVESCLESHPAVLEAAVYGVDDEEFGQLVVAAVCLRPGADVQAATLRARCEERLAYYKVPALVTIRSRPLPRNAAGKVLKRVLEGGPRPDRPV